MFEEYELSLLFVSGGLSSENVHNVVTEAQVRSTDMSVINQENCAQLKRLQSIMGADLTITFSPVSQLAKMIIRKHWHILCNDSNVSQEFINPPIFTTKPSNLTCKDRFPC